MNRVTGLLVIEAINSNPNGNPDMDSDPRQRHDERGEISPVSVKRKLRDLVDAKEGDVWKIISQKFDTHLKSDEFEIFERRGRDRDAMYEMLLNNLPEFKKRYWDARIFGNTFLEKAKNKESENSEEEEENEISPEMETKGKKRNKGKKDNAEDKNKLVEMEKKLNAIKTGVVQFVLGTSVSPIRIKRYTTTVKAGVEANKLQGMAPFSYRIVEHGLYCMPFFVNPNMAHKTGCTNIDLELLYKLIPYAYTHNPSYVRPYINIRHAWVIEHKSPLGSCPDHLLFEALNPTRKKEYDPKEPSLDISEYDTPNYKLTINDGKQVETELKDFPLKERILKLRDLMQELD